MLVDRAVDFGHEADGFAEGDDDPVVVLDVGGRERPAPCGLDSVGTKHTYYLLSTPLEKTRFLPGYAV